MSKSSDPLLTTVWPHSDNLHYHPHGWTLLTLDSKAEPRRTGGRSAQLWTASPSLAATRAITEGKASGPVSLGHTGHRAPRLWSTGSQRVRHYWACTHTSLLHMMFPRPKMLEYLYTHAHTHKHTHTSFHRLAHLSGASSSGELPWLYLCPLELCSLLLLCDTRTLWTSHFNVIAVYSVKCLSQNGVN